jgi:hypothetical protein
MIYNDITYGKIESDNIKLDNIELCARLGVAPDFDNSSICPLIDEVYKASDMRCAYFTTPVSIDGNVIDLSFDKIESVSLAKTLHGCDKLIVLAVTIGSEVDRLIAKYSLTNKASAFIVDAISSALTESLADYVNKELKKNYDLTNRFSPGYADLDLNIQAPLIKRLDSQRTVGIYLNENLLMIPKKSITAIIGIKSQKGL